MKKNDIKYSFALLNDELVNINDFDTKPSGEFYCVGCGRQLIARMGKIKRRHFSHKEDCDCSSESYLHKLGKQVFYDEYRDALKNNTAFTLNYCSFNICTHYWDIWGDSCSNIERKSYGLTKKYRNILVEKSVQGFIADIVLEGSDLPPILVEIVVTHKCEQEKIDSGLKIVEINIESEEDVEKIRQRKIDDSDSKTTYYNIETKTRIDDFCKGKCHNPYRSWFIIYPSQKCVITTLHAEEFKRIKSKAIYYKMCDKGDDEDGYTSHVLAGLDFESHINAAHEAGVRFNNCFLCRYHASGRTSAIFCKTYRKECSSFEAITCDRFRTFPKDQKRSSSDQESAGLNVEDALKFLGL